MTDIVTLGASCEASDHPTECTEPAPGTVQQEASSSLTINGTQIASVATADMHFDSHAHDHTDTEGCHDNQSHDVDPDTTSSSLTLNGSPLYIVGSDVGTDPGSDGSIDILDAGSNTSVTET